ncbi:FtsW/RodA/SpoVE family cell cycle protein [Wolinella succinogenes]|uniref:FtsW/RodA/SpoVE family cell cycle protein n=1 Tax=Wolinella succinogenes TaxID=844 RepID=UPI002FC67078
MIAIDRRILTHFDFLLPAMILPLVIVSYILIGEVNDRLADKQATYVIVGFISFFLAFLVPIRKLSWSIPFFYWINIALLISVEIFGTTKLGAQRWIEIPFIHFTLQPSELMKPAFILMLAHIIRHTPPPKDGYRFKSFAKISFYILLPFVIILKQPDLGTALVLLLTGYGMLFLIGVHYKIWLGILLAISIASPVLYSSLHDYQRKRITDFLSEKPSYHVQQSIIAIGSGGLAGKAKDEATQAQLKFLPIATSDFIFAYHVERFGFWGAVGLILLYLSLILHLLSLSVMNKNDYFLKVVAISLAMLIFIYAAVNVAMTIGLAPVVGLPLPMFSYGGSSFVTFMVLLGMLENLLAFRFNFMYNFTSFGRGP